MRRSIIIAVLGALLLVFAGSRLVNATPGVCPALSTGHQHDANGPTHTYTAPAGYLITRICVKAGSANQGDGPHDIYYSPPVPSATFSHPSGKDISHYSAELDELPPPTTLPATTLPATTLPDTTVPGTIAATTVPDTTIPPETTAPPTTEVPPSSTSTLPTTPTTTPSTSAPASTTPTTETVDPSTTTTSPPPSSSSSPPSTDSTPTSSTRPSSPSLSTAPPPNTVGPPGIDPPTDSGTLPQTGTPTVVFAVIASLLTAAGLLARLAVRRKI